MPNWKKLIASGSDASLNSLNVNDGLTAGGTITANSFEGNFSGTVGNNLISANQLNVTGNGTTSQFLRSDGDGTFTWATPTNTNYFLNGITKSGNTLTFSVSGTTNRTYTFGSNAFTSYSNHVGLYDAAGSADVVNTRIDEDVIPAIPTNNNQLTNGAGYTTNVGDITGVTAGVGLSGGGSSGGVTLTLDMSELTDMTAAMVGTDEFIVLDAGADRRKAASEIGLSIFSNDAGFITDGNTGWNNSYGFITATSTDTLTNKSGNISMFTNDSGYTTNVGDITGVTAGGGLSGGGTSGTVTLSHSDTSSQSSVNNSGRTYIQDITLDTYGHITGITSATETVVNTDTNTQRSDEEIRDVASAQWINGTNTTVVKSDSGNTIKINSVNTNTQRTDAEIREVTNNQLVEGDNVTLSVEDNTIVISSTDTNTNTTYSAGSGLTLSGTTFSLTNTYDNYNGWDLFTDGTSRGRITSGENVNFVGGSNVSLSYSSTNNTITINSTDTNTNTTYSAGGGLTLSGTTFSHTDTSSQGSVNNGGRTYIQDITLDTYGHITGITSATETVVNTDTNTQRSDADIREVTNNQLVEGDNVTLSVEGDTIVISSTDTNTQVTNNNQISNGAGYQTSAQVNTAIQNVVDSAPAALDTLNEIAASLNDDSDFAGTMTTALAGKLSTSGKAADSNLLDGLDLGGTRANVANKVVRTDSSGYLNTGWINTTSGNTTSTITDFYVNTNDGYIRKATKAHVKSQLGLGSAAYVNTSAFDAAGSADVVNTRIDEDVIPAIPTNNNQLTNGAGYITSYVNTVDMGDGFIIEDGDGTEVRITENKEVKFVEGTGIDINWTDTSTGSDGDPYDLRITNTAPDQIVSLTGGGATSITGTYPNFTITSTDTNTDTNTQRSDEEIRDVASAQWINGTNTTVVKSDSGNTIKINSVNTNTQRSDADIREVTNNQLVEGDNVTLSVEGDTIVISSTDTNTNTQLSTAQVRAKFSGNGINTSTGVITDTNTQLTDAQVRSKFSAGSNVSISAAGVISSTDTNTQVTNNNQISNGAGYLTSTNDRVYITDSRGGNRLPNYYNDRYAQWDFQSSDDTNAGGDGWHAIQTISKWSSFNASHRQEQLIFTGDNLKRRTAESDTEWGELKTVWDSGNLNPVVSATVSNDTTTFTKADGSTFALTTSDANSNTVTSVGTSGNLSTGNITLVGAGATSVTKSGGTITISSTDTNTNTNYFLNGITKSGNTLTFSVSGTTNRTYTFGSNAFTSYSNHVGLYDAVGSADAVNTRIDEDVIPAIPTNNNQLTNGAGYITSYTDTNTNRLTTFQVEDGDGTEVTISHGKEWKFLEGQGINVNWTDTSTGSDGDPFDLQFALKANGVRANELNVTGNGTTSQFLRSDGDGSFTWATPVDTNTNTQLSDAQVRSKFSAGSNVSISAAGVISATDTNTDTNTQRSDADIREVTNNQLQAGDNVTLAIEGDTIVISSTDTDTNSWRGIHDSPVNGATTTSISSNWAFDNVKTAVPAGALFTDTNTNTTYSAGGGLSLSGTTFSHTDTSSQGSVNNSGRTYIQDITLDTYGHITGITSATETVVNTDTNTTYSADGNYGMTLSGTAFRLENDRRRNSTTTDIYTGNTHDYTFYDASVGIRWYTAGSEEMRLDNSGNLHVDADVVAYSTTVSDERLKDNVTTIENPLDKIKALRGVEYDWNSGNRKGKHDLGLIAQEVEKVLPNIVHEHEMPFLNDDEEDETLYKTVDYEKVVAVLIEGMKEQQSQIDELKSEISKLKGEA